MRNRLWAVVVVLTLLLLAIWLWHTKTAPVAEAPASAPAKPAITFVAPPQPALGATSVGPPVVIDGIDVEKNEVCEGDENLITVHAHTARAEDEAELQVQIGGMPGTSIALRWTSYLTPDGTPPKVTAYLDPDHPVSMVIPEFKVNPCRPQHVVEVVHRPVSNLPDHMEFWARITDVAPGTAFKPTRYHWDFGNGTIDTTTTPIVEKSFRERTQDTLTSNYLITCTIDGEDGTQLVGRDTLAMRNGAYENLSRKRIVVLEFDKPRFPEANAAGVVEFPIKIWHHHTSPVTITSIHVRRVGREISPSTGGPKETEGEIAVDSLLHGTQIPPTGIDTTVRLDTRAEPDVSYLLYQLTGTTAEGLRVAGEFSVMRPTDLPTREHSEPVGDPVLMSKIMQAQKILGKQYVTDEDLWRLEREGKIDGHVDAAKLPQKAPPLPVGPKGVGNQPKTP